MKKQDNESLIQEITKRLDWYTMEASDEEFDADEVQTLLKLLDSLKGEEKEEELPVEEALDNFWKYCEERQEEERILEADGNEKSAEPEAEHKESGIHKVLWYFHRHRMAVVTAVVLIVVMLGGSWQMAVNAEKHGGFFWWMDKNEEGTTMITAPEGGLESEYCVTGRYTDVQDVPDEYKEYALLPLELSCFDDSYNLIRIEVIESNKTDTIYDYFEKDKEEILYFEVTVYQQEILRVRETYPGYVFCEEFENDGINLEVFEKEEENGKQRYVIYFYYGNEKYAVVGVDSKENLKKMAVEYQQAVINNYSK